MLVDFSVSNFRSIKEEITFSMETGAYVRKYPKNVLKLGEHKLLKSAVLFGQNGSGKSNVLKSLLHLRNIVSFDSNKVDSKMPYEPFIFDKKYKEKETSFRVRFLISSDLYDYEISHNAIEIFQERLSINNKVYFDRSNGIIPTNLKKTFKNIRKNKTVVFHGQDLNDEVCKKVYLWFVEDIVFVNTSDVDRFLNILKKEDTKRKFLDFLYFADTTIIDAEIIKQTYPDEIYEFLKKHPDVKISEETLLFKHKVDEDGLDYEYESSGTIRMVLFALVLLASKNSNKVIIYDEFDIMFHQSIIESLINLMNHEKSKNQYILSSHQIGIMDFKLRRDQIWITDKSKYLSTSITSIFDFELRTDMKISTQYLKDRFSGMPIIDFERLESVLF